jgi:hypothetical protein
MVLYYEYIASVPVHAIKAFGGLDLQCTLDYLG